MAKYLMLKHYRGAPTPANAAPISEWTEAEMDAHFAYCDAYVERLRASGELVDSQALSPEGSWVRFDGEGRPPRTDGPFAETKDLVAGWVIVDVETHERALELAGELSAAPGKGGEPLGEWLELRPFVAPAVTSAEAAEIITREAR
ncbi:YciI family protein [Georgenia sp. Z1344]|uniref:YciI family protein n=1 Tax=Georgenia sp. Z1344 TaxID=3416706 RepID=UPI003CE6BD26